MRTRNPVDRSAPPRLHLPTNIGADVSEYRLSAQGSGPHRQQRGGEVAVQLFPYQVEGAKFLATVKRGLLADEMGLGKSAQAISACDEVGADYVVVVCPASLRENWVREFKKFARRNFKLDVRSYDRVARGELSGVEEIDVLILDEAHYLKSKTAKRTKAIFGEKCDGVGGLVERAKHVFCLTGTPTPNNPSELWPMLRAVMPKAISKAVIENYKLTDIVHDPDDPRRFDKMMKPMAYWPFVEKFCVTQDTGFGIKIIRGKNLPELKQRIAPFILRRKKDEVLKDLPPIRFDTLALDGEINSTWRKVGPEIDKIRGVLAAEGVAGLKAIAPHVAQLRRVTGMAKATAAVEWIIEQLEGGIEKLVVFAHHRDVIDCLLFGLGGFHVTCVHGGTDSESRQAAVDEFQDGKVQVFIGQIQAAGTGLTLTAASDVLFVESSWVPAENEQAAMRVHRIGQRNACLIRFAMLAGSIDEDIQRAVMRKTQDISRLFS